MGAKYTLHPAAFREELLNAAFMVAEMEARALKGFEFADAESPFRSGDYKANLYVTSGTHGGVHNDRAWAELGDASEHAAEVEWGNGAGWHGAHVMTRAIGVMQS